MADSQNIPTRWLGHVGGDSGRKSKRSKRVSVDEYLAGCLVALAQSSCGSDDTSSSVSAAVVGEKQSEASHRCSICGKGFRSHQALGGHKASHRSKPPPAAAENTGNSMSEASDYTCGPHPSRGLHTCPTCGKSFSMGQALGGHMRKHYSGVKSAVNSSDGGYASSVVTSFSDGGAVSYSGGGARNFDLNLPRSAEDTEVDLTLKL